jgi:hypothetical protein
LSYNTSAKQRGLNKIIEFEFEIQTYNILCTNQTCKDFIQASKIPCELLFRQCSCYSGTRGVTTAITKEGLDQKKYEGLDGLLW